MSADPSDLRQVLDQMESLVRRAYADGYRQGSVDASDKMLRAVQTNVEAKLPIISDQGHVDGVRMSPPRRGVPNSRGYVYGSVIATFRQAIMAAPDAGMTKEDLLSYCQRLNIDVTLNTYRDVMKRLVGGEEVERKHGAYFPGRRLRADLAADAVNGVSQREPSHLKTINGGEGD